MSDSNRKLFFLFSVFAVVAAVGISLIPSTMVYRLRLFDGVGLPEAFAEFVRFVIVIATPLSVGVVGLIRVFGVSDNEHEEWLGYCIILEIASLVCEIGAAMLNGTDVIALIAQGVLLCAAIVTMFLAVSFSITKSGWFKLAISQHQHQLEYEAERARIYREMLNSEKVQSAIQDDVLSELLTRANKLDPTKTMASDTTRPNDHTPRRNP